MTTQAIELTKNLPSISLDKEGVENLSLAIIDSVMKGDINPIELAVNFKSLAKVIDNVLKSTEAAQLSEAESNGGKYDAFGASISVKEGGVRWDYTDCGNTEYDKLCEQIDNLNAHKKELEQIMQVHNDAWIYTNSFTGETYEVQPPVKKSKKTVEVRLK